MGPDTLSARGRASSCPCRTSSKRHNLSRTATTTWAGINRVPGADGRERDGGFMAVGGSASSRRLPEFCDTWGNSVAG